MDIFTFPIWQDTGPIQDKCFHHHSFFNARKIDFHFPISTLWSLQRAKDPQLKLLFHQVLRGHPLHINCIYDCFIGHFQVIKHKSLDLLLLILLEIIGLHQDEVKISTWMGICNLNQLLFHLSQLLQNKRVQLVEYMKLQLKIIQLTQ